MNAGQDRYNLAPHLPLEVAPGFLTLAPAAMSPPRRLVNQAAQVRADCSLGLCISNQGLLRTQLETHTNTLKNTYTHYSQIILRCVVRELFAAGRGELRAAHGLPPRAGCGLFSVPPGVARVVNLLSCIQDLVSQCYLCVYV